MVHRQSSIVGLAEMTDHLPGYSITLENDPSPDDVSAIREGLRAFNRLHAPDDEHRELVLILRGPDGSPAGGLLGDTYWGWLQVGILWLDEKHRRQGHGTRLLAEAEAEARRRGCHHAHLDTMDFQSLPFYEKRGYRVWGELEGMPEGHRRIFLSKWLV
jgi:GNAT superfamily N-acetyltransferase